MNWKKIIIAGLLAAVMSFAAGSVLYMNPWVSDIYAQHGTWPGAKSMDEFGGLGNWMFLMLLGSLAAGVFIAILYSYTENKAGMEKGCILRFSFLACYRSTEPLQYMAYVSDFRYNKYNRTIQQSYRQFGVGNIPGCSIRKNKIRRKWACGDKSCAYTAQLNSGPTAFLENTV